MKFCSSSIYFYSGLYQQAKMYGPANRDQTLRLHRSTIVDVDRFGDQIYMVQDGIDYLGSWETVTTDIIILLK